MGKQVGLWINHAGARILELDGAESRVERRRREHLRRYYDEVAARVRSADQLLIMGPDEAPVEFRQWLHGLGWDPCATILRRCQAMTDDEFTAAVKSYFGRPAAPVPPGQRVVALC